MGAALAVRRYPAKLIEQVATSVPKPTDAVGGRIRPAAIADSTQVVGENVLTARGGTGILAEGHVDARKHQRLGEAAPAWVLDSAATAAVSPHQPCALSAVSPAIRAVVAAEGPRENQSGRAVRLPSISPYPDRMRSMGAEHMTCGWQTCPRGTDSPSAPFFFPPIIWPRWTHSCPWRGRS